jgi:hypothetical protein
MIAETDEKIAHIGFGRGQGLGKTQSLALVSRTPPVISRLLVGCGEASAKSE